MSHDVHADRGATPDDAGTTARRSLLARAVMAIVAISIPAFILMIIGDLAGWKGFSESETDNSAVADAIWITFSLSALVAFVLGIVTFVRSRRGGRGGDRTAGIAGMTWLPVAVLIVVANPVS